MDRIHLAIFTATAFGLTLQSLCIRAQEVVEHPPTQSNASSVGLRAAQRDLQNESAEISGKAACGSQSRYARLAPRLRARGFSPAQYFSACQTLQQFSPDMPQRIEDVAVLETLGYEDSQVQRFLERNLSLKEFIFRRKYKLKNTGAKLMIAGAPIFLIGGVMFLAAYADGQPDQVTEEHSGVYTTHITPTGLAKMIGGVLAIGGVAVLATGTVMLIVGSSGLKNELPREGLLESGSIDEIRQWHDQSSRDVHFENKRALREPSGTEERARIEDLVVSPVLGHRSAGLSLGFQFDF